MRRATPHEPPSSAAPAYSKAQIVLHWAVVALVVLQWINHEAMEDWWREVSRGEAAGLPEDGAAIVHIAAGAAVLVLMAARIAVRWRSGAPEPPAEMPPLLRRGAALGHFALYATLVLLPVTGLAAVFIAPAAAAAHALLTSVLLALVLVHVLAALYHLVVRRDGVFRRIFVPR
jgi:cytochrome b561